MSLATVQAALIASATTALGAIATEQENVKFTPPTNTKWAKVSFLPATPVVETLGSAGQDRADGVLQIDLNYPIASGNGAARTDYEAIRAVFPAGSRHTNTGQVVMVTRTGRSAGRIVDNYYRVSVSVFWYALIPR